VTAMVPISSTVTKLLTGVRRNLSYSFYELLMIIYINTFDMVEFCQTGKLLSQSLLISNLNKLASKV